MNMNETRLQKLKKHLPALTITLGILALWHLVCTFGHVNAYVLPPPQKVWKTFLKMASSGELLSGIGISLLRVFRGFSIAFALAFGLACVRLFWPKSEACYGFLVRFFRNVPPLSMIPLLILWCGIGETTKTVIIVLASFFPMYLSIVKGFTGCDRQLLEVARSFAYSRFRTFFRVVLPSAVPDILVGMRTSLGYSWRSIIGAEMVAASTGLGHLILFAQQMSRTDKVIIGIFAIGLIGCLCDLALGLLIRRLAGDVSKNGWD